MVRCFKSPIAMTKDYREKYLSRTRLRCTATLRGHYSLRLIEIDSAGPYSLLMPKRLLTCTRSALIQSKRSIATARDHQAESPVVTAASQISWTMHHTYPSLNQRPQSPKLRGSDGTLPTWEYELVASYTNSETPCRQRCKESWQTSSASILKNSSKARTPSWRRCMISSAIGERPWWSRRTRQSRRQVKKRRL